MNVSTPQVPVPADSGAHIDAEACRLFAEAAELAGKKWSAAIMLALARGVTRFTDIGAAVEGVSDRLLTARLRELEAHGLVLREVVPSVPVRVRYMLTQSGHELITILNPLVHWAKRWEPNGERPV